MQELFSKHISRPIGVSGVNGRRTRRYLLQQANKSYFTLIDELDSSVLHIPYRQVSQVFESEGGIEKRSLFGRRREPYNLLIRLSTFFVGYGEGYV